LEVKIMARTKRKSTVLDTARMLSAVEAQYGSDSSEYEQAGGTRQSERRRSSKKGPTEG
jgi:hypothetical protein